LISFSLITALFFKVFNEEAKQLVAACPLKVFDIEDIGKGVVLVVVKLVTNLRSL
jgi:hypothetical protein